MPCDVEVVHMTINLVGRRELNTRRKNTGVPAITLPQIPTQIPTGREAADKGAGTPEPA